MNDQNAASPSQAEFVEVWLHYHGMETKLAEMETLSNVSCIPYSSKSDF